jgi:hypothetical protein
MSAMPTTYLSYTNHTIFMHINQQILFLILKDLILKDEILHMRSK